MANTKHSIDVAEPESLHFFSNKKAAMSPRGDQDKHDGIAHNNLKLANRIFDIMEGPGIISHILKKREKQLYDHPGTLNFKMRVKEATRIHKQNISMAMRLDHVKPYYQTKIPQNHHHHHGATSSPTKAETPRNRHNVPGLDLPNSISGQGGGESKSARQSGSQKMNVKHLKQQQTQSARGEKSSLNSSSARKNNVLLEYSKIQNGRVLDVAVIKEPFQDRYAIFGIDIDNGKRYELRLTSDDVSSILDGDILVTSLDNVEVWLALLNKVTLKPVDMFSKLASPPTAEGDVNKTMTDADTGKQPEAPSMERPTTRPGGRGSRGSQTRVNDNAKAPSADQYEGDEFVDDVAQSQELHSVPIVVDEQGGDFLPADDEVVEQSVDEISEAVGSVNVGGNAAVEEPTDETVDVAVVPGTPVQPAPPSQPKGAPNSRPSSRPASSRPK